MLVYVWCVRHILLLDSVVINKKCHITSAKVIETNKNKVTIVDYSGILSEFLFQYITVSNFYVTINSLISFLSVAHLISYKVVKNKKKNIVFPKDYSKQNS